MKQNNIFKVEQAYKNLLTLDKPHTDKRGSIQSILMRIIQMFPYHFKNYLFVQIII